jgi:hypothetical protein
VAQHDAFRCARDIVVLPNEAADFGAHSEHGEHPIAEPQGTYLFRLAVSNNGHVVGAPDADVLEDPRVVTIGEIAGGTLRKMPSGGESGSEMVESYEPVRLVKRQRLQEHTVDNAEDGRRRADSQRERENRHDRETGLLPERAHDMPQVLHKTRKHICRGDSWCDRQRRVRLPQRRHVSRQSVTVSEIGERQLRGFLR